MMLGIARSRPTRKRDDSILSGRKRWKTSRPDESIAPVGFVSLQTGQNVKSCKKARSLVHSRFDSIDASLMFAKQHMGERLAWDLGKRCQNAVLWGLASYATRSARRRV